MISVIVPAHNEAPVLGRLLRLLTEGGDDPGDEFEIIVVANGCEDDTADVARGFAGVRVVETPVPSKAAALRLGDEAATGYPRVYVDADVEVGYSDVLALARALAQPGLLAAAPRRVVPRDGVSWPVRWYYDTWERLPNVTSGLFGRGVVALSREGLARVRALPDFMSDDLAMSSTFVDSERQVVAEATVVVHPPRTWADLMRRRVRVATGTHQLYAIEGVAATDSRTRPQDLARLVLNRPLTAPKVAVFAVVALMAKRRAARALAAGDFTTWLRDDSSRRNDPGS